jgi:hypothetical protein
MSWSGASLPSWSWTVSQHVAAVSREPPRARISCPPFAAPKRPKAYLWGSRRASCRSPADPGTSATLSSTGGLHLHFKPDERRRPYLGDDDVPSLAHRHGRHRQPAGTQRQDEPPRSSYPFPAKPGKGAKTRFPYLSTGALVLAGRPAALPSSPAISAGKVRACEQRSGARERQRRPGFSTFLHPSALSRASTYEIDSKTGSLR